MTARSSSGRPTRLLALLGGPAVVDARTSRRRSSRRTSRRPSREADPELAVPEPLELPALEPLEPDALDVLSTLRGARGPERWVLAQRGAQGEHAEHDREDHRRRSRARSGGAGARRVVRTWRAALPGGLKSSLRDPERIAEDRPQRASLGSAPWRARSCSTIAERAARAGAAVLLEHEGRRDAGAVRRRARRPTSSARPTSPPSARSARFSSASAPTTRSSARRARRARPERRALGRRPARRHRQLPVRHPASGACRSPARARRESA